MERGVLAGGFCRLQREPGGGSNEANRVERVLAFAETGAENRELLQRVFVCGSRYSGHYT